MKAKLLLLMLILSPFGKIVLVSANADPSLEIGFESVGLTGWDLYIANKNYGDGNAIENQPQSGSFYTPIDENELVKKKLWDAQYWYKLKVEDMDINESPFFSVKVKQEISLDNNIRFLKIDGTSLSEIPSNIGTMQNEVLCDPKVPAIKLRSPNGSNSIARLGNSDWYFYTERMSYTFTVTEKTSLIRYYYAIILEDPGHSRRPYFYAEVSEKDNVIGSSPIACSNRTYIADSDTYKDLQNQIILNEKGEKIASYFYKDWSSNMIDLSEYIGKEVTLSFVTSDCGGRVHAGYAYVDAEFVNSNFEIAGVGSNKVCMGETQKFSYPGAETFVGERYTWKVDDVPVSENSEDPILNYEFTTAGKHKISLNIDVDGADESLCQFHQTITDFVEVIDCVCPDNNSITIDGLDVSESIRLCKNQLINIAFHSGSELNNPQYVWSYNEQSISDDGSFSYTVENSGELSLSVTSLECKESINLKVDLNVDFCSETACNDCPSKFSPKPGEKYVVGGWVNAPAQLKNSEVTSFTGVYIEIRYSDGTSVQCYPKGNIIDGWQRISETIVIPEDASKMTIALKNSSGAKAYFDDIRFHPFNATMKSYVYDPETLRLSAELDDENYATFYDYDEEGALVRVRKETERGVMTIQEARQSTYKTK